MRKIAKDNIIVVCTIVLCIMLTLALCVSFSEGGLLSVFNKVESKSQTMWAIACKGYSDISMARFANIVCLIMLMSGITMICTGINGLYLSKTYMEVKRRPHYIIKESNCTRNKKNNAQN